VILVTGGTGFIGQALIRHLVEAGYPVRTLIRPSRISPNLPKGVAVEVAVCSLSDERGLHAAMVGVDTVYHLAGGEWKGTRASLMDIDIRGTQTVAQAAAEAGVERFFSVSHLGADRASAYPVFKAKAIAEEHIRRSGVDYTILRSAIVYGPRDGFTTGLARLLHSLPFIFLVPGDGTNLLQPLWVEDLVTCLVWALEDERTRNQVIDVGGPEQLSFRQITQLVMRATGVQRRLVVLRPPYLRALTILLEHMLPGLPVSVYWLDYLAANHTCALDSLPRTFNLMPARISQRLAYLQGRSWRVSLLQTLRGGYNPR
jgi:NADH dehydrogenase